MGEVYRARNTALGRDVALKGLPASFSNNAMRVERQTATLILVSNTLTGSET